MQMGKPFVMRLAGEIVYVSLALEKCWEELSPPWITKGDETSHRHSSGGEWLLYFCMKHQFQWVWEKVLHREAVGVGFHVPLFCDKDQIQKSSWWRNNGLLVSIMILL